LHDGARLTRSPTDEGAEAILWLSTDKGFADVSTFSYFKKGSWYWGETHEIIKRQDLIMGWLPWPEPPCAHSLLQDKN